MLGQFWASICWNLECVFEAKILGKQMPDEVIIDDYINEKNCVVSGVVEVDFNELCYGVNGRALRSCVLLSFLQTPTLLLAKIPNSDSTIFLF